MASPTPKPTRLKILTGNRGKRPLNESEPDPPPVKNIRPPSTLTDKKARREWYKIAPILKDIGVLSEIDVMALAAYCQVYSRWIEAEENVRKLGMIIKTKTGYPVINPYLAVANTCLKQMRGYLSEFGMTPASRSRVTADKQKPEKTGYEDV